MRLDDALEAAARMIRDAQDNLKNTVQIVTDPEVAKEASAAAHHLGAARGSIKACIDVMDASIARQEKIALGLQGGASEKVDE